MTAVTELMKKELYAGDVKEKSLKTVQADGKAEEIRDRIELSKAMVLIAEVHHNNNLNWSAPIYKIKKGDYRFIKFTPRWIRLLNFRRWSNIVEYEKLYRDM